jgi:hypothetical protein
MPKTVSVPDLNGKDKNAYEDEQDVPVSVQDGKKRGALNQGNHESAKRGKKGNAKVDF